MAPLELSVTLQIVPPCLFPSMKLGDLPYCHLVSSYPLIFVCFKQMPNGWNDLTHFYFFFQITTLSGKISSQKRSLIPVSNITIYFCSERERERKRKREEELEILMDRMGWDRKRNIFTTDFGMAMFNNNLKTSLNQQMRCQRGHS